MIAGRVADALEAAGILDTTIPGAKAQAEDIWAEIVKGLGPQMVAGALIFWTGEIWFTSGFGPKVNIASIANETYGFTITYTEAIPLSRPLCSLTLYRGTASSVDVYNLRVRSSTTTTISIEILRWDTGYSTWVVAPSLPSGTFIQFMALA